MGFSAKGREFMKRSVLIIVIAVLVSPLIANVATADWRLFVWTYEYKIQERGTAEFEEYVTFSSPEADRMKGITAIEHQLEVEIGMSSRYDFAIYQVFKQAPEGALNYDGFKLRSRFLIGRQGEFYFDPLLYFEYKGKPDFSEHEIELKLIAARQFEKFLVSVNPILELKGNDEWETEIGYAIGTSYMISRILKAGIEFKGNSDAHYIGPVISHGQGNLWAAIGTAFAYGDTEDGKPELQIRFLMGIGLAD